MAALVYGARLEIVYTRNSIEGSNPSLCATKTTPQIGVSFLFWRRGRGSNGRMVNECPVGIQSAP